MFFFYSLWVGLVCVDGQIFCRGTDHSQAIQKSALFLCLIFITNNVPLCLCEIIRNIFNCYCRQPLIIILSFIMNFFFFFLRGAGEGCGGKRGVSGQRANGQLAIPYKCQVTRACVHPYKTISNWSCDGNNGSFLSAFHWNALFRLAEQLSDSRAKLFHVTTEIMTALHYQETAWLAETPVFHGSLWNNQNVHMKWRPALNLF